MPSWRFRMQGAEYLLSRIIMDGVATPADDRSYEFASKAMTELFEIFPCRVTHRPNRCVYLTWLDSPIHNIRLANGCYWRILLKKSKMERP